ncbi:hypothetical protein PM082_020400 [Marasmius tenuissimus]|nr:hypothetical protein PM082_020400 [Marasmius tenuissimus]
MAFNRRENSVQVLDALDFKERITLLRWKTLPIPENARRKLLVPSRSRSTDVAVSIWAVGIRKLDPLHSIHLRHPPPPPPAVRPHSTTTP